MKNMRSMNGSNHPFAYRIRPFGGGSDHYIFNDGALSVPSVMFGHGDTFHHTSLDTPDKVDASELRRVCVEDFFKILEKAELFRLKTI